MSSDSMSTKEAFSYSTELYRSMGMATHSSVLAWRIPWMKESGGLQSMGHTESDMTEGLTHTHILNAIGNHR